MADIAFLLLVFFLVATTMETDKGIMRKLPPMAPPEDAQVNDRNIMVVLVNRNNQLMVEGEHLEIEELREKAKEFILNKNDDPDLPVLEEQDFPLIGDRKVTGNHVISLRSDRGTTYEMYIAVQNELVAAYNELRNELALEEWGMIYKDLPNPEQDVVDAVYPLRISEAEPNEM